MFCSSQFLSTPFAFVQRVCVRKNNAAKSYDVEKKKTAYLARAVMSAFGTFPTCRMPLRMSANRERPEVSGARSE
jgi:hypothetical protein